MSETKEPRVIKRHPATLIPQSVVNEINYRVHLLRLEPSLTPEQSVERTYTYVDNNGKERTNDDASRRRSSEDRNSATLDYLRVLVDLGLIEVEGDRSGLQLPRSASPLS